MTNRIKLLFALLLVSVISARSIAQTYPFTLPANMTATVNVTTTTQEPFNNLLLGTNTHELAHSEGQALVRDFDPITIRFPHGLFANWYDWEQDKARVYGDEMIRYKTGENTYNTKEINFLSSIKIMDANNLRVGINELATLNTEKKAVNGEGFDMMWTLNMSADGTDFNNGSPVTVARYNDLISKGFQVKAMEMGNECFYPTQRSSIIPNSEEYIARAKSIYTALKALDPNIKLSVPLSRKGTPPNEGWNTELTQTTDYFDAVTVHTYVGSDPDDPSNSDNAYSTALTAREYLRRSVDDYSKVVAPDKPIWLTEWGVKSGGPNGVSALGMADCYMFLSENQDTYERANWFSVNGKLNSFLVWHTVNNKLVIKEPLEKTSYGSTFEIIRSVYENSTLLGSEMTVPKLDFGVNAVNARAVKKDGKTILFVVNLSNQEVPFTINMDGVQYTGGFEHKAMAFSSLEDEITLLYDADPLQLIKEGNGSIQLPKYSISTIVLDIKEILPLDFTNLATNDEIKKGSDLVVEAALNENFKEVSLWVNNTLVSTKTQAPYTWSAVPVLTDMMDPIYSLKLVGKLQNDQMVEKEITITTPSQWPYTNDFTPHTLPGKIEIEHYDYGGKGIAYFDKREQNPSFSYRGDDIVDFSSDGSKLIDLQSGEWLEYTVDVAHSGNYDFVVNHQTRRSPEFPAMSLSFPAEDKQLLTDLICTNTGSGVYATDTFKKIFLEKGQHILRLDILSYGFELDYFEFVLTSNTIDYNNIGTLNNPSNPLFYDTGDAIQHLEAPQDSIGFEFAGWFTDAAYTNIIAVPFVTATDDQNKTVYAKWTPKSLAGTVTIYGNIVEAQTLTVDTTLIENNSGKLIYQWQKATTGDFTDITGATDYTYTLKSADVGSKLRVLIRV